MGNYKMCDILKIWGIFDFVKLSKVIWGSLGAFVLKWLVSQKRLAIEQKVLKFRTRGHYIHDTCI